MAGEQKIVTMLALPTELLHRICDFLDTETIVQALRRVCVQLFAITQTYNRYKVRLDAPWKMNICRIIPSEHIIALDLHRIDANRSKHFLLHVITDCRLRIFSISSCASQDVDDLLALVSPIISQSSLLELTLNFDLSGGETFQWPQQCTFTHLLIGTCTFEQWCSMLQHCPRLHTLTMNNCLAIEPDETLSLKPYSQLTSLTFNDLQMTMDKLEYVLALLPALTHLDLSSSGKPFQFVQRLSGWEMFLRWRLPRLSRLECCIFCYCCDWDKFDTVVTAFRTPFWHEEKRWFITCQFRDDWTSSFTLFTSPERSLARPQQEHHFDTII